MENIKVGDFLLDRDTRRVGRKLKVVFVEKDDVTVEVVADSINAKKTTVGTNTDIARSRLKKGYTLEQGSGKSVQTPKKKASTVNINVGTAMSEEAVDKAVAREVSKKVHPTYAAGEWHKDNFTEPEDNDVVNDPFSLENALNSAGYFWLPPVADLVEAVKLEAPILTKTGLVHLIHNVIRESLVTGQ